MTTVPNDATAGILGAEPLGLRASPRYPVGVHFVIMGCGRVGAELTIQLAKAGHTVGIVDRDRKSVV